MILESPPPNSPELEQSILATCLLSADDAHDIVCQLSPDDFYHGSHQEIFKTVQRLSAQNRPADLALVVSELMDAGKIEAAGGASYVASIIDMAPVLSGAESYCAALREKAIRRKIITESIRNIQEAQNSPDGVLDRAQRRMLDIGMQVKSKAHEMSALIIDAAERYQKAHQDRGRITGIPTGYKTLDAFTYGLQFTDLIILAARPSMGKTSLALGVAAAAAKEAWPVLIFSLEMSKEQLVDRLTASEAMVNSMKLRSGWFSKEDWERLVPVQGKMHTWPITICDEGEMNLQHIVRISRQTMQKLGRPFLVVIDYLQLMPGAGENNRNAEIEAITRGLKGMAKDLKIPVLLLSQLNRKLEERADKRPILADLRDSGSIEQDADVVAFIYRDEVYNKDPNNPNKGLAEIIFRKHRNGPTGTVMLGWDGRYTRFDDTEAEGPVYETRKRKGKEGKA